MTAGKKVVTEACEETLPGFDDRIGGGARRSRCIFCIGPLLFAMQLLVWLITPAWADFMDGWEAYHRGEFETALKHWLVLGEEGDAVAQYNVGVMYDEGTGVARNTERAADWWHRAAVQGHPLAQHNLALFLIERAQEADLELAAHRLQQAASAGFAPSQYSLGKLFAAGLGVERDDERAFALFLQSGRAGFVKAQYSLGKLYRDGLGVEADAGESVSWFSQAAHQGYAKAQEKLATRYAEGEGVEKDLVEALKWATLAAREGHPAAQQRRRELLTVMTKDDILEAERRSDAFQPRTPTQN